MLTKVDQAMTDTLDKDIQRVPHTEPVVYIAGPMTGYPDYNKPAFYQAENYLRAQGHRFIRSPVVHEASLPYKTLIDLGLKVLKDCDVIFMLTGWYKSRGARLEHLYAVTVGLEIIYQDEIQDFKGENHE